MDNYGYADTDLYQDVQDVQPSSGDELSKARAGNAAFYLGLLAIPLLITISVLSWLLWAKVRSCMMLTHAILAIVALIIAILGLYYASSVRRISAFSSVTPNAVLSLIIFLGSLLFAGYFALSSFYLWAYRCFHNSALLPLLSNSAKWQSLFGARGVQDVASSSRCMYFWICVLGLLVAICFAVIAYCAYSNMTNHLQTAKIAMMIALLGVVLFAALTMIWALKNRDYYGVVANQLQSIPNLIWLLILLLIAVIAAAIVNSILNLFRWESAWFVMGIVWLVLALALLFVAGLMFRDLRRNNCDTASHGITCKLTADTVPASASGYAHFCPEGKYLPAGQTCRKVDLTVNWESDASPVFLNPSCCGAASAIALWPFFTIGVLLLFTLMFAAFACASCFAHTEPDPAFAEYFSKTNIVDFMTLGLALLAAAGLLAFIFFGLRVPFTSRFSKVPPAGFSANADGTLTPLGGFAPVSMANATSSALPANCYSLSRTKMTNFVAGPCPAGVARCGVSVGLLAVNGLFDMSQFSGPATLGSTAARGAFFPKDLNSHNDFIQLMGTQEEINESVRKLVICERSITGDHSVYATALPVDLNSPDSLIASAPVSLTDNGALGDFSSFNWSDTCVAPCRLSVLSAAHGQVALVGQLLVKSINGTLVPYGPPMADLELNLFRNEGGARKFIGLGSYDSSGRFTLRAPYSALSDYTGTLEIRDPSGRYQPLNVDTLIAAPPKAGADLNMGDIVLSTKSGAGCASSDVSATVACLANQSTKSYNLLIDARDALNAQPASGAKISLRRGYSGSGELVAGPVASPATFSLPAGYYSVEVSGKGFANRTEPVLVDQDRSASLSLLPSDPDTFMVYMDIDNTKDPNADYDLNLKMKSADGSECIVTSFNPVCPWAKKVNDVLGGERGIEAISVSRFINGTYMAYVTKGPVYNTCPQASPIGALTTPVHFAFGYYSSEPGYSIFTSTSGRPFGGPMSLSSLGASLGSFSSIPLLGGGDQLAPSLKPASFISGFKTGLPVKVGGLTNMPLLFTEIKNRVASGALQMPKIDDLFALYGGSGANAYTFLHALPILYGSADVRAWAEGMLQAKTAPAGILQGLSTAAGELSANKWAFDSKRVNTALGQQLELELANANKRISGLEFYGQLLKEGPTSINSTLAVSRDPRTFVPGIGEEPYLVSGAVIGDSEVGIETHVPKTPAITTFVGQSDADLVGIESLGQTAVYRGNGSVAAYPPGYGGVKPIDLSKYVPDAAPIGVSLSNATSAYYSWIVPTMNPEISRYIQDQQGLLTIEFQNGTVLYTNVFNETSIRRPISSQNLADGTTKINFDDESSTLIFANGTTISSSKLGGWRKVQFPMNATSLLYTIGAPATTVTTSVVTAITPADAQQNTIMLVDSFGNLVNKTGENTYVATHSTMPGSKIEINPAFAPTSITAPENKLPEPIVKQGVWSKIKNAFSSDSAAQASSQVDEKAADLVETVKSSDAAAAVEKAVSSPISATANAISSGASAIKSEAKSIFSSLNPLNWFSSKASTLAADNPATIDVTSNFRLLQEQPATETVVLPAADSAVDAASADAAPQIVTVAVPEAVTAAAPQIVTVAAPEAVTVEAPQVVTAAAPEIVVTTAPQVAAAPVLVNTYQGTDKFRTHFCFNGFGPQSIKSLWMSSDSEIPISECEKLYGPSDPYWLGRLGA